MPHAVTPRTVRLPVTRKGLSVIEVLIALVVVTVGLLGMAGASAVSARAANAALRQRSALELALARLAALSASGCPSVGAGSSRAEPALTERWTVGLADGGVRSLQVRVEWEATGARRALALESAVFC